MPLIIADRVLEASTTTGTGVFTLTGASLGFRSFASVCSVADTVWYYIEGVTAFGVPSGEYEYGLGTYSGANQITRTTVRGSSNGGSPVNFSAGTKLVGISPMAPFNAQTRVEWRSALFGDTPTFSAYLAVSGGSVSPLTFTKFVFDTELWDTTASFAASRFTPNVAGYFQINAAVQLSTPAGGFLTLFKNGAEYKRGAWVALAGGAQDFACSGLVYCNGTTDYIEAYLYHTSGGSLTPQGGAQNSWFDGYFVRGA